MRLLIVFVLLLFLPLPAQAWGPSPHRIIATLAEAQLTPAARREVTALLAVNGDASLADIANWADTIRNDPAQRSLWRASSRLHYVNLRIPACTYQARRDCRNGQCIVAGIDKYLAILGDRRVPAKSRAEALRFVVHVFGDIHQPLHAGDRGDGGGNGFQLQLSGKGTNLHRVWDSRITNSRRLKWQDHATKLMPKRVKPAKPQRAHAAQWAIESCRIVADERVYPSSHIIDKHYLARMLPIAERRLQLAGKRLAAALNQVL